MICLSYIEEYSHYVLCHNNWFLTTPHPSAAAPINNHPDLICGSSIT